ncbi:hypothetical protein [Endozoicomonas sp. ONNA2]|uniref:hypothetical protein n=1 Tax=Endozoicomonas sp. ONNA2 TaxID=2828741 RepID=UPI0021485BDA|nr:hypothetical protein [Endozoicomonas sp. ONNA2]
MTKHNPEPLAKIVTHALTDITLGRLHELDQGEIDALLHEYGQTELYGYRTNP